MSNDVQDGTGGTQVEATSPAPQRPGRGIGSAAWMGYAMALMMGMRVLAPMMRSANPDVRHLLMALAVGTAPVAVGVQVWRRREERKAAALRAERARARMARGGRATKR